MFTKLPSDLNDLITYFAWGMRYNDVFLRACIACEVNNWDLPEMFIRKHRTDWSLIAIESPLRIFSPQFSPESWFRMDFVFMLLDMLDFRRKDVREHGDRASWVRRLTDDWTTVHAFNKFYMKMLCSDSNWKKFGLRDVCGFEYQDTPGHTSHYFYY